MCFFLWGFVHFIDLQNILNLYLTLSQKLGAEGEERRCKVQRCFYKGT